jgi:hypothetical protein
VFGVAPIEADMIYSKREGWDAPEEKTRASAHCSIKEREDGICRNVCRERGGDSGAASYFAVGELY